MYCPFCGRSIADGSKFCSHCGKPTSSPPKSPFSDAPPQYISEVALRRDVPTKKNWRGKVFCGFRFRFSLLDSLYRPTRSDGKVRIRVTKRIFAAFPALNRRSYVYEATIEVQNGDFGQHKYHEEGFGFNIERAVLEEGQVYDIEIWFKTPDGRKLYGTSRQ